MDLDGDASCGALDSPDGVPTLGVDVIASAGRVLGDGIVRPRPDFDEHGRVPHRGTLIGRLGLTRRPVVDEWFALLAHAISTVAHHPVQRRDLWNGAPCAICSTHDVDRVHKGWADVVRRAGGQIATAAPRRAAGAMWRTARAVISRRADLNWNLDEIVATNSRCGSAGTFYIMASQDHELDADYDINTRRWKDQLRRIVAAGGEVALHAGYESDGNADRLTREKASLEDAARTTVPGIRQHFLRFDPSRSWAAQMDAGFDYDSTLGFHDQIGFRAGTCYPFPAFDAVSGAALPLIEVPLIAMDRTLERYLGLTPEESAVELGKLLDTVRSVGGCLNLLWHNTFFVDDAYPGWRTIYENLLSDAMSAGNGALPLTARNVADAARVALSS